MHLGGVDAVRRREVEGVERLHLGEARLAEPLPDDGLVPRRLLRAQHFLQVVFVGPMPIAGLSRQGLEDARDARQLQGAGVRDDEVTGDRAGAHEATAPSHAS
jgi:hypothetical protein